MCDVLRLPRHRHCLVLVYCSYCMIPVYETSQSTATKADNESETEAECMAGAGVGPPPGWARLGCNSILLFSPPGNWRLPRYSVLQSI